MHIQPAVALERPEVLQEGFDRIGLVAGLKPSIVEVAPYVRIRVMVRKLIVADSILALEYSLSLLSL